MCRIFSVWGLSQLFAGAALSVILSVLEVAKLVITTALHTYWDKLAKSLRGYLIFSYNSYVNNFSWYIWFPINAYKRLQIN
jgi:hypothetical protein